MRLGGAAVRRIWTVELHPRAGGPNLVCAQCTARTPACEAASARSAALAHLACHARADALPGHLRTCQCRAQGCRWHPRHRVPSPRRAREAPTTYQFPDGRACARFSAPAISP
ncbi:hypothetical protein ACWC2H_21020, partial [Streptomyces sp. 900105755]